MYRTSSPTVSIEEWFLKLNGATGPGFRNPPIVEVGSLS